MNERLRRGRENKAEPMPDRADIDRLSDPVVKHARQDYVRVMESDTVDQALERVGQSGPAGRIVYFYVVDEEDRLRGVVPTRRLLLSPPETPVAEVMERRVVSLPYTASLADACEFFIMHRLLALPVVDGERHILGVIDVEAYTDEVADLARREEAEDLFQLIGLRLEQLRRATPFQAFLGRFPWLLCNLAGGLACAVLGGVFEAVLQHVIVLALFIPVVLALAESVTIQSLSVALQTHERRAHPWPAALRALRREMAVGLLLGAASGGVVALAAWIWQADVRLGLCIALSITAAVTFAATLGLAMPTALRALARDPKIASGPVALALVDTATLTCYLGMATVLLLR